VPNPTTMNTSLVRRIQFGRATRADLMAGGGDSQDNPGKVSERPFSDVAAAHLKPRLEDPRVVQKILRHVGLPAEAVAPRPPPAGSSAWW
jgi:hypothetical protein